jgi:serine/threonine protein kinase
MLNWTRTWIRRAWGDEWEVVHRLPGGAQGVPYIVVRRGTNAPQYFLKELISENSERRERMYREVAFYRTLTHRGIPDFVESNAEHFQDETVPLYLVTELVPGVNLREYVARNGPRPAGEAIDTVCRTLAIVGYAHSQDTVHRDIKRENVMLRDNNPTDPVVVDFGMSFLAQEGGADHLTKGHEIGNRFLRLPEFSVNSPNKRDPRSDVTLCAGLLFFLLTSIRPSVLENHEGLRPHQTIEARRILSTLGDVDPKALQDIFDRAFRSKLDDRWQRAVELAEVLSRLQR